MSKQLSDERVLKVIIHIVTCTIYLPQPHFKFQRHQCSTLAICIEHSNFVYCTCAKQNKLNPQICYANTISGYERRYPHNLGGDRNKLFWCTFCDFYSTQRQDLNNKTLYKIVFFTSNSSIQYCSLQSNLTWLTLSKAFLKPTKQQ